ncbi:hypothetical protein A2833_01700 [Candidatus Azambacteria bacterium RIFCSPHIGHO2_01_FULL_44_55]|uniref:Uncharacterized protein n=1 Tax=Candidatus Azambacteria bacterium RIFCSPLOWO2_02_FULL_44_14 TaxID=1797306 RepID=A0A1F5C9V9_9BACT|nr:MAG: hypothetical protein A3A18_02035 [Candidatus Azambacteria bacterium RIFCSPLOWO2_01_FULL_44_84]OGD33125.1 MAG: hypothetical protein A3C78_02555 [Candidatus Azambacteria bacterium RIFCSPHIGHO2_02_FULL_45_18]OGD39631.1 MAG: hypothetical protein A3I30_04010 [Candidatus Azambacteria bacterium RIFCSPLOWO2_02_FULL_44_14]OGD40864.1 MAG: hypothetical protein A2833_01700 [Candidatus Azambacteria bacterium RIFCSPHIGHO2_01_FULL_44_55]OGD51957.1 MAG: hypothetical protein A2608_02370 [Candidatus Azam
MFSIIPISLIIVSLGLLLYIVSRRVSEIEILQENQEKNWRLFDYLGERVRFFDMKIKGGLVAEKSLHKARRLLLKTDNLLMGMIGKIKNSKKPEEAEIKTDNFWHDIANHGTVETKIIVAEAKPIDIKSVSAVNEAVSEKKTETEVSSKKRNKKTDLPA